jgi:glucose-6-phosphate 1-epimerase
MDETHMEAGRRFDIADRAQVVEGQGGLPKVQITSPEASAEMYLHGAHVTSWKPAGTEEVFFVSRQSRWEHGRAIRGGVPVCFPWFGNNADNPKAPAHGLVRTKAWKLESVVQSDGAITVDMFTESDDETRRWWPADFRLALRATFGSTLTLALVVTNTGTTTMRFEEALHSYCRVGNIHDVRVRGLNATKFLDKPDANLEKVQQGDIAIVSETDRVFLDTRGPVDVDDAALRRRVRTAKDRSLTTVVWNPWVTKAQALSDLADDEWSEFVCVETCNVAAFAVQLAPGQQHTMRSVVSVSRL